MFKEAPDTGTDALTDAKFRECEHVRFKLERIIDASMCVRLSVCAFPEKS